MKPDGLEHHLDSVELQRWQCVTLKYSVLPLVLLLVVGPGPVGATAAAAAIKWIVKDGLGAAGRLLVGGRLGQEFDDDPRRWRMAAEALTTAGKGQHPWAYDPCLVANTNCHSVQGE